MQARSADRAYFAVVVLLALAPTRGGLGVPIGVIGADRGRQDRRIDFTFATGRAFLVLLRLARSAALLGRFAFLFTREGIIRGFEFGGIAVVASARLARPRLAIAVILVIAAATLAIALVLLVTAIARTTVTAAIVAAIIIVVIVRLVLAAIVAALALRLCKARLVVGDHAQVVVRELQIVFSLHAIAIVLGVLRKLLVLVEQLRSIAPRAAVDAIGRIGAALIAVAASTTTVIAIHVQG